MLCDLWAKTCSGHNVASTCISGLDDPLHGHRRGRIWTLGCQYCSIYLTGDQPQPYITAVSYPSWDDGLNHNDAIDEVSSHCYVPGVPYLQVDVAHTTRWHQQAIPVYPCVGIGDISFISNDEKLSDSFEGWTSNSYPDMAPRSFDDVLSGDIMEWLSVYARDQAKMALVASAFPGSIEEESAPLEAFDTVEGGQDRAMMDVTEDAIQQETELDEADIPNLPIKEAERTAGWRSLPQKVRIAIRRLHRQFGHVPQKVLLNLLRSARVSKQYIDAVKYFRCVECEESAPPRTGHKTSLPNRYEFNYALGIDVLEILDADGAKYQVLNMICLGACFQLAEVVRAGPGQPTSARCLEAIKKRWISWAGNPSTVQCDRGLHNRGVRAQYMSAKGIQVYHAPLETPEAIGRVERHGGVEGHDDEVADNTRHTRNEELAVRHLPHELVEHRIATQRNHRRHRGQPRPHSRRRRSMGSEERQDECTRLTYTNGSCFGPRAFVAGVELWPLDLCCT